MTTTTPAPAATTTTDRRRRPRGAGRAPGGSSAVDASGGARGEDPAVQEVLDLGGAVDRAASRGTSSPPRRRRRRPPPSRPSPGVIPPSRPRTENVSRAGRARATPRSRPPRTGAAGRPSRRGSSGGSARSSPRARTGRRGAIGPFAAQSRLEPLPYSLPASTASGDPVGTGTARPRRTRSSPRRSGRCVVHGPSVPGASSLRQADVRERAAHHHLVVATASPVGVEVAGLDAALLEVTPGR